MIFAIDVRPKDCDTYGHVNNAAYISFMEYAFTAWLQRLGFPIGESWMLAGTDSWHPAEIVARYTRPAYIGQTLQAEVWLEKFNPTQIGVGCLINHPDGETALHGYSSWKRVARQSGEPLPIPGELFAILQNETLPAGNKAPVLQTTPEPGRTLPTFCWPHTVRRSEIRAGDWIHPAALFHWVEEAVYMASASVGWPAERIVGQGMVIVQHRHDMQIHELPRRGEVVELVSRVVEARKVRGTWRHDIFRQSDETLLAQNWSVGVFMTHDGHPCRPPAEMMAAFGWG